MKRFLVTLALTLPMSVIAFVMGSFMNSRGTELITGTIVMSVVSFILIYIEDFSKKPEKFVYTEESVD